MIWVREQTRSSIHRHTISPLREGMLSYASVGGVTYGLEKTDGQLPSINGRRQMEALEFSEVADLLNCSSAIVIEAKPAKTMPANWDLYRGAYTIHGRRFPFEVLYVHSRASEEAILRAKKDAFTEGQSQVVYAPSTKAMRALERYLKPGAERFVALPEYLASFVKEELSKYTAQLIQRAPLHYVEPKIETPRGVARRLPNPLESFLDDPIADELGDGHVAVLLAEPGQGKTYMCDHLVARLAKKADGQSSSQRFTPIYINAEQWKSMDDADISSLHKTMTHCFRYFESPIGWLDGNEEVFLRTTLRAGLFQIVFDGFDEYVLRSHGGITATEALSNLCNLARSTGTRIVITARTTFWLSEIEGRIGDLNTGTDNLYVYHIEPFEYSQANQYFNKRLGQGTPAAERASSLYKRLQYGGDRFVGRGFVLSLIADLYERDAHFDASEISGGPVTWLLHALCEREQLRQSLPLNSEQQLSIVMQCAVEEVRGRNETDAGIALLIQSEDMHLDEDASQLCRTKLTTHPLMGRSPTADRWSITEGQAKVALVARFLTRRLAKSERDLLVERFSNDARWDPGFSDDLAAMLVEQNSDNPKEEQRSSLTKLLHRFLLCDAEGVAALPRLAVLTAIRFVDSQMQGGNDRTERINSLLSLLPKGSLTDLRFSGSVSRFDFRGRRLSNCRFQDTRWANCRFDSETVFERCNFKGGSIDYCEGFGLSQFEQCDGDEAGMAVIHAEQISAGARIYSDADLRTDIKNVMQKFIPKGGFILKSVRQDHLRSGPIRRSRFAEMVITEITRHLLKEHRIAGSKDSGLHVKEEASECVKFFATNNVFTGPLDEAYKKLRNKTGIEKPKV
jgi:NACHT domain